MEAIGIFLENEDERERAEKMGFTIPDEKFINLPFVFDITKVVAAFKNNRDHIVIYFEDVGSFEIDMNEKIFQSITEYLNTKK